jgi:carboxymethylenebutenolidase
VDNIEAAVLGVYSSDPQDFASRGRQELDQQLTAAGVTHQFKEYPGTRHAFHNDTGAAYNREQAVAAWNDMLAWFKQHLA